MTLASKVDSLRKWFSRDLPKEKIYQNIIQLGSKLPNFPSLFKTEENLVKGCQSTTYLRAFLREGNLFFEGTSDALISSGLIHILSYVYSGESPDTLIQEKAVFLEELGIFSSLSLNRSNGLSQMVIHIKRKALEELSHSSF